MSSRWVNKYAIMRDLSLAQGCVPVDVVGTVEAGDKPPSLNIKEETEEEFYHDWVRGDGDFSAPDLGLIKKMLDVVRNHDSPLSVGEDDDDDDDKNDDEPEQVIQIRKLNPLCPEFLASGDRAANNNKTSKELKKKKSRNVAIESLLQNMKENLALSPTESNKTLKLVKPTEFVTKSTCNSETVENVKGWLNGLGSKTPSPPKKTVPILDLDRALIFKKRKAAETITPEPIKEVKKTSLYNYNKYVPSENADKYYKRFLKCSEMQQMVQDNVWTKVERQMKEIDERRKAEAELFSLSLALCESEIAASAPFDTFKQKLGMVWLPQHRHQLAGACAVCRLAAQRGIQLHEEPCHNQNQLNHLNNTHVEIQNKAIRNRIETWGLQGETEDNVNSKTEVIDNKTITEFKFESQIQNTQPCQIAEAEIKNEKGLTAELGITGNVIADSHKTITTYQFEITKTEKGLPKESKETLPYALKCKLFNTNAESSKSYRQFQIKHADEKYQDKSVDGKNDNSQVDKEIDDKSVNVNDIDDDEKYLSWRELPLESLDNLSDLDF